MPPDSIAVTNNIPMRFEDLGVDVAGVFAEARISPALLTTPGATITTQTLFALWFALERCAPRDIALRLADQPPTQRHLATLVALQTPNLRAALQSMRRYKRLTCPEELSFETRQNELRIHVRWVHASGPVPPLLVEAALASMLRLVQHGTGLGVRAKRVDLSRAHTPGDQSLLESYFAGPVRFDAPIDALVLDASAIDLPFITREPQRLDALVPELEAKLPSARSFAEEVRTVLHHRWTGQRPSVRNVARALCMSQRSLQRRLTENGTSYQTLLDESRREAARRMLANTSLQLGQIAFLLGFQEPNSFYRAFHAWERVTPSQWRAAQRAELSELRAARD